MVYGQTLGQPLVLSAVLGNTGEPSWHNRAHAADAAGELEIVRIAPADAPRRRMCLRTDKNRDIAIALPREIGLVDGAVLRNEDGLMIVARIDAGPRLRLTPADLASAVRLGYFCGNLHWKANFVKDAIEIQMDGPDRPFQDRLADARKLCAFTVERLEADT